MTPPATRPVTVTVVHWWRCPFFCKWFATPAHHDETAAAVDRDNHLAAQHPQELEDAAALARTQTPLEHYTFNRPVLTGKEPAAMNAPQHNNHHERRWFV